MCFEIEDQSYHKLYCMNLTNTDFSTAFSMLIRTIVNILDDNGSITKAGGVVESVSRTGLFYFRCLSA